MNVSIANLKKMRKDLERDYANVEKEISSLYLSKKNKKEVNNKEKILDSIDQQLNLIDMIINNLEKTPRLYDKLIDINRTYKQNVGE